MAEPKPLYRKALELARALGELPQWRESRKENIACARAIDKAIAEGYDGMHLQEGIAGELTESISSTGKIALLSKYPSHVRQRPSGRKSATPLESLTNLRETGNSISCRSRIRPRICKRTLSSRMV